MGVSHSGDCSGLQNRRRKSNVGSSPTALVNPAPSSSGLGYRTFNPDTGVQIPVGSFRQLQQKYLTEADVDLLNSNKTV